MYHRCDVFNCPFQQLSLVQTRPYMHLLLFINNRGSEEESKIIHKERSSTSGPASDLLIDMYIIVCQMLVTSN